MIVRRRRHEGWDFYESKVWRSVLLSQDERETPRLKQ